MVGRNVDDEMDPILADEYDAVASARFAVAFGDWCMRSYGYTVPDATDTLHQVLHEHGAGIALVIAIEEDDDGNPVSPS